MQNIVKKVWYVNYQNWFSTYRWVISFLKPYTWALLTFIALGLVVDIVQLYIPQIIQLFVDQTLPNRDLRQFYLYVMLLVIAILCTYAASAGQTILRRTFSEKTSRDLQFAIFSKLRKLGFSHYERTPVGETLSMFNTDVSAVQKIYTQYFPSLISQFITLLVCFFFLIRINLQLSLWTILCFGSYYLIGPYLDRKAAMFRRASNEKRTDVHKRIYNSISGLLELRILSALPWDLSRLSHRYDDLTKTEYTQYFYNYMRGIARQATISFGALVMFIFGSRMVQSGAMSIGEMIAFTFYYYRIMGILAGFISSITEQRVLMFQAEKIRDFTLIEPLVKEKSNVVALEKVRGNIVFENVQFSYSAANPVLKNVNLEVISGEKVAIVGTSGNGKTTLLKLIARFYDPQGGTIYLDGIPLTDLSLDQIRDSIGIVFQETYLFGNTIRENIRFGDPAATFEQIERAAKAAYAHDFIMQLPDRYDSLVGERGIKLSGGQKQRIAIARMLIKNPRIVLLDEATSALDTASEGEVKKALDTLLQGKTTLAIAHRLTTVRNYDKIILIHDGEVAEMGTFEQLMGADGLFAALVRSKEVTARE